MESRRKEKCDRIGQEIGWNVERLEGTKLLR